MQGAIEVWEYSMRQISIFRQSQLDSQAQIKFRHVPFSWFPVVRSTAMLPCICTCSRGQSIDAHVAPALQKDAYREADKAALQEVKHIAHVLFFIFMSYLLNSLVLSPTTVQVLASVSARCKPGTPCA